MKIEKICELDKLDFKITKNKNLTWKRKDNKQYKKCFIHNACKQCGSMFISYNQNTIYCCQDCAKFNDIKTKSEYNLNKEKKEELINQSKIICELCNKKSIDTLHLSHHLVKQHNYNYNKLQEYYDKYFKKEKEDVCIICGEKTKYNTFVKGYKNICSMQCKWKQRKLNVQEFQQYTKELSNRVKTIWENRTIEEKETIFKKANEKNKKINKNLTKEQLIIKYGWLNKLQEPERTIKINDILSKSFFKYIKNETEEQKNNRFEKRRQTCIRRYGVEHPFQNSHIFEKVKDGYNWYEFELSSGKIIKVQGYERYFLPILLKQYDEQDIFYKRIDVPEIWYIGEDNKKHRYYADFYIPKDNMIIEVKSIWTYNIELNKNWLKKEATETLGFDFKFVILNTEKEILNEPNVKLPI